jgi:hypothetical protein
MLTQPRDLRIVAMWEDVESPLGRLFGWTRQIHPDDWFVDREHRRYIENSTDDDDDSPKFSHFFRGFLMGTVIGFTLGYICGVSQGKLEVRTITGGDIRL